jgi:hypothetical protein
LIVVSFTTEARGDNYLLYPSLGGDHVPTPDPSPTFVVTAIIWYLLLYSVLAGVPFTRYTNSSSDGAIGVAAGFGSNQNVSGTESDRSAV